MMIVLLSQLMAGPVPLVAALLVRRVAKAEPLAALMPGAGDAEDGTRT